MEEKEERRMRNLLSDEYVCNLPLLLLLISENLEIQVAPTGRRSGDET
jgi:hypothetical protein